MPHGAVGDAEYAGDLLERRGVAVEMEQVIHALTLTVDEPALVAN